MSEVSADDRDLAIRTMLGEEGSDAGQAGVAAVILNRLAAGSYGGSVGDVVLAPKQFEAWTRQSDQLLGIRRDDPRYVAAGQLFDAVRDGSLPDPTNGATHFYAPVAQAALGRQAPGWAQGHGLKLGSSMFYAPQGRVDRKPETPNPKVDFARGAQPQTAAEFPSDQLPPELRGAKPVPSAQKTAPPIAAPQTAEFPTDQLPPELRGAKPVKPAESTPGFVEKGLGEAGRVVTEGPKNIKDMFLEGTAAGFGAGQQNVERGVAAMKGGPGGWLGGASSDIIGTAQEAAAPLTGGLMTLLGVLGSGDPAMVGAEAPHVATQADALRFLKRQAPGEARAAAPSAEIDGLVKPLPGPGYEDLPADKAAGINYRMPDGTLRGATRFPDSAFDVTSPSVATSPIEPPPRPGGRAGASAPAPSPPRALPPDQLPPELRDAKPVAPVAKPSTVGPAVPGPRIDAPSAQALVDELRKRFGVEQPVPVSVSNTGSPTTFGKLTTDWRGTTQEALRKFRFTGVVDPTVGEPVNYKITVRSDPSDRALSVGTLLHEFGHVLQNDKFRTASAETRAAVLAAFHRETRAFGTLSPEEFPATALDSILNARIKDLETRLNGEIVASSHQEYNQRFNEWFANQVATWFTSTREATSVVDKFFKGIADAWRAIYQRVTGRQGAAPEIDAFMRGLWDEGKAVEEAPRNVAEEPRAAGGEVPVTIQFRGKAYSGATKLDAVSAAQRATGISLDRIWDEATPERVSQGRTLPPDIPTTVYRGSGRADPRSAYNQGMGPQSEPIAGPGRYYAFKKADAETFGPSVAPAEMPVQNPLVIRDGNAWRELTRKAGWQTPNPSGTSEVQMREMTQRLQDVVRGMGHDGIVAYWDDSSPYDIGPKGENLKLLRNTFGVPQVVEFEEEASRVPMRGKESAPHDEDEPIEAPPPLASRPGDLGAAVSPPGPPLPDRPTREMVWEQEDRFNRLMKAPWADKSQLLNVVDSWPMRMRSAWSQRRFYKHMEDPSFPLNAQERADYEQYIAPLKREERELWERAKKTDLEGIEDFDPTYAHRKRKGLSPEFDRPLGVGGGDEGPLGGQGRMPMSTSSMRDRVFYAIQDVATGERKIVARDKDGNMRIIEPGKPAYPIGGAGIKIRDPFRDRNGRAWTLEQARTDEIEGATGLEYYQNAGANTIDNIVRLRQVVRAIHEVDRLKGSPEWTAYAQKVGERGISRDWREPKMPLFRGWRVHPRLTDVIDDFYGHEPGSLTENLAKINRWTVGTMFWSPVTHIANVGTHWFTARGWDNVTPQGMLSLAVDGARAFREVAGRGEKYQELLRDGNGLLYASTSLQKFSEMMLKRLGEDVVRNPARWDPIARTLGVGPSDLVRMMYEGSSRVLWSVSDMFMMQRVLELERKGMSTRDAIEEAERHIPNYRAHSEVLGNRAAAQVYFHPLVTEFSRYHYGQLNSWANIAKDAVGGGKDALGRDRRLQALGNVMATGFMMVFVAPLVNEELKKAFGSKVRLPARGSTTLAGPIVDAAMQAQWAKEVFPKYIRDYYNDDSNLLMTAQNLFAIAPITRGFGEAITNLDWFSGRRVAEPAEVSDAVHDAAKGRLKQAAGHAARFGLQEAEHAGERLVQPLSALSRIMQGDKGLVKGLVEQGLGLTEPNTAGIAKARRREESEASYRRRHPRGPLEELGGRLPF